MFSFEEFMLIYGFALMAGGVAIFSYLEAKKRYGVWDVLLGAGTVTAGVSAVLGVVQDNSDWYALGIISVAVGVWSLWKILKRRH